MAGPFDLSGPLLAPAAGGRARELVILLHGYGADGRDLIGLAPHWARDLPHAAFVAPNAPFPCEAGPYGYQWFSFADRDPAMLLGGVKAAAAILQGFIAGELGDRGLGEDRLALVGFSQGAMMALHVAPRRIRAAAAVVGYSGALVGPDRLASEIRSRPPILLVHGDADPVVPFAELAAAATALESAGLPVTAVACPGLAHGIDETGLTLGGRFLAEAFAA
ncbi:MAG: alpha/beta fold hydrolase [Dongiaceae bacterium]